MNELTPIDYGWTFSNETWTRVISLVFSINKRENEFSSVATVYEALKWGEWFKRLLFIMTQNLKRSFRY